MAARKLEVVFVGDTKQLEQSFKRVGGQTDAQKGKFSKLGGVMKGALAAGAAGAAAGLTKTIGAATDLNEQVNKASVVFRGAEKGVISWSKTTATSIGVSQRAALEAAGTFGNMLVPMGFARKRAAEMSKGLVNLSGDLASFNNASPEETLEAIRAGLAGETEPLRRFGIFLNDARLKQEAMNLGLKDAVGPNGALTANAKAQATYSLILKDSKDAQGDFARTSTSLANSQRIVKAQAENLAAGLGQALLPAMQSIVGVLSKALGAFQKLSPGMQQGVVIAGVATVALGGLVVALGSVAGAVTTLTAALGISALAFAGIVAGVAVAVAAGILLYKNWDKVKAALGAAWDWIKGAAADVFGAVASVVTSSWNAIKSATTAVWGAITGALKATWEAIRTVAVGYFTVYKTVILAVWGAIKAATSAVWGAIKAALGAVWGAIKAVAVHEWNGIKTVVTGAWGVVKTVTSTVWNGIKSTLSGVWGSIKSTASGAWGGIRSAVVSPMEKAVDRIRALIGHGGKDSSGLVGFLGRAWDTITGGVKDFGGAVKDGVVGAFKGVLGQVLKFAIKILEVVGKIPGVSFDGAIKKLRGMGKDAGIPGFARGGEFGPHTLAAGSRGQKITRPMAVVGEEAPRHPEFIVPTNPAYRGRALGLFGQLGQQLGVPGFADGGVIGAFKSAISKTHAPAKAALALFEAGVVESGMRNLPWGDRDSRGALQIRDSTARGMGVDNMNPLQSALAFLLRGFWGRGGAISLAGRGGSAGWVAQQTQGSAFPDRYDQAEAQARALLTGKGGGESGGGLLGFLAGLGGDALEIVKNGAGWLIGKLPKPGDFLPGWLSGLGTETIKGVSGWIRDKVSGLLGSMPSGNLGDLSAPLRALMAQAQSMGLAITSTTGGQHAKGSYHYLGRAFDASNGSGPTSQMRAFALRMAELYGSKLTELFYDPLGWSIKNGRKVPWTVGGHSDHVHVAMAQGGVAPGGWVRVGELGPEWAQLPAGTRVVQASDSDRLGPGRNGPLIGQVVIQGGADEQEIARRLAWQIDN